MDPDGNDNQELGEAIENLISAARKTYAQRISELEARVQELEARNAELEEMGRAWHESDEHKHANELRDRVQDLEEQLAAQAKVIEAAREMACQDHSTALAQGEIDAFNDLKEAFREYDKEAGR